MNKKRNSLLVIVLLLLVGLTFGYVSSTYAKYTSKVDSGEGTAQVAKWAFEADNSGVANALTIDLSKTYDADTLIGDRIAPGTDGSFVINVKTTNTETGVDYTLKLKDVENVPTNLKFYKDSSYTEELTTTGSITGTLAPKNSTGEDVTIYWKWLYETPAGSEAGDTADTTDGKAANTLTVTVELTGVQVQPA